MKVAALIAAFCAMSVTLEAAQERLSPQPRVRLVRESNGAASRSEPVSPSDPTADGAVVMEKMTVSNTKLPTPPKPLEETPRESFSATQGGPFLRKTIDRSLLELGIWPHIELFAEEARFKPQKTHGEVVFARMKW